MGQQQKHQSVVDISGEASPDSQAAISENKFRSLFDASPISLYEQDFSGVKQFTDHLSQQGITDFRAYFEAHPEDVATCLSLVKVNNANQATLKLYEAADQAALLNHLEKMMGAESFDLFQEELVCIGEGKTSFESEGINYTLDGEKLNVLIRWSVIPGFEETFSQVIVSILDITSQKQAEEQLRQQAAALESAANAIVITNNRGNILWVNPAFTTLTGYTFQEVLGKTPKILKSGLTNEETYQKLWQTILAGEVWRDNEIVNRHKDGSLYVEQMTIAPVKNNEGDTVNFVAIKENISQRKEIERQLRQQLQEAELLREIVAINPTVDTLNEAFTLICEKLGAFYQVPGVSFTLLDKEAMFADIIGEYLVSALEDSNDAVTPLPNIVSIDTLLQQKTIEFVPNVQKAPRFEQARDILQAFANHSSLLVPVAAAEPFQGLLTFDTNRDKEFSQEEIRFLEQVALHLGQMLQRIQAEQKLQKQHDFAHQIMNNMGQGLLVLRADKSIEFYNPAFAQLLGYAENDLLGRSLIDLVGDEKQAQIFSASLRKPGTAKFVRELALLHADGRQISVLITAVLHTTALLQSGGLICVVTDLSAQKKIEHDLAEARDQAVEATRLKSEFLANMSHEIRTPLNAVIGMTSLMLDSSLTLEQQDYAQTIRSSGEVLLALINDILDFSKIEAGKLALEKQPFTLRDCIEEALDVVVSKAAEKDVELAYIIDDLVPNDILGDVTRVRQILVNLLNNAIKFTKVGEVVLSVACAKAHQASNSSGNILLHFAVKDTGIGIPQKKLDRLFKSFSQVDASTTRKHGGTGLGLAISKQLVELMGGQIWVESEQEKGSTFHFTILTRSVVSKHRVYGQKLLPQLKGKRLLIVDDNETNCKILLKQSSLWGMLPTAVLSGADALALLQKEEPFDLAILDMQMPEMDGIMLAAELHKIHNQKQLPLVMLSSIGERDAFKDVSEFSAFLTKPVKQQLLFDTLTAVFSDTAVQAAPPLQKLEIDASLGKNHPLRILLAEDNLVNQKVALRILERMGYRADIANDGLEVLEALQRQPYDVVLMDVQMPQMDGVEATEQIRDIWPLQQQPDIIAMTAHALTGDREKYLAAGMDNYISKPVRIQELLQALAAVTPLSGKQNH